MYLAGIRREGAGSEIVDGRGRRREKFVGDGWNFGVA